MRDRQVPEDEKERRPDHAQDVNEDPPKDSTHALCFSVGNGPVSRSRPAFSKAPDRCEKRPSVAALPIHQGDRGTRRRPKRYARRRQENRRGTAARNSLLYRYHGLPTRGSTNTAQSRQRSSNRRGRNKASQVLIHAILFVLFLISRAHGVELTFPSLNVSRLCAVNIIDTKKAGRWKLSTFMVHHNV